MTTASGSHRTTSIRDKVEAALAGIARRDPDAFVAMLADDAVLEFPLERDEARRSISGKPVIAAVMEQLRDAAEMTETSAHVIYVDESAQIVFFEAGAILRKSPESERMQITQAVVIAFRDGLATRWTDYRAAWPIDG